MRPAHRIFLALGIVCLGAVSGFFAAHLLHPASLSGAPNSRVPTAAPAGPPPSLSSDSSSDEPTPRPRTVPDTLPAIALPDLQGKRRSLADWKGHPVMVNFWATWCEPCRREIPLLERLRHERSGEGLQVIGIAVDFRDAVERYAREMRIDYPVLVGEEDGFKAISAFAMDTVFPFTVFADRQGRILTVKVGELHPDEARFILDRLSDVDRGSLELAAARREVADGVARLAAERARTQAGSPVRDTSGLAPDRAGAAGRSHPSPDPSAPHGR